MEMFIEMERILCRLCLDREGSFMNIFEENNDIEFVVRQTIQDLLQIEAAEEEGFPWLICMPCLDKLADFRLFKNHAIESNRFYDFQLKEKQRSLTKHSGSTKGNLKRMVLNEQTKTDNGLTVTGSEYNDIIPSEMLHVQVKEEVFFSQPLWTEGSTSAKIFQNSFTHGAESINTEDCFTREANLPTPVVENETSIYTQGMEQREMFSEARAVESHPGPSKIDYGESDKIVRAEIPLSYYESHLTKARRKGYQCCCCAKMFSDNWQLRRHLVTHTKEQPFECSMCHKKFSRKDRLSEHVRQAVHGQGSEDPLKCSNRKNRGAHRRTSHPCRPGLTKSSYSEHDKIACAEIPLNSCKSHLREVRGKGFHCPSCDKVFSDMWKLRRHLVTHTKEQPFECRLCQRKFSRKDRLSEHIRQAVH